jgi:hypothetical protein
MSFATSIALVALLVVGACSTPAVHRPPQTASQPPAELQPQPARPRQPEPPPQVEPLPPHRVGERHVEGKTVTWFIVAEPGLARAEADAIGRHYRLKEPDAEIVNIEILCDGRYASQRAFDDPSMTDRKWASHLLFLYVDGPGAESHGLLDAEGLGSACTSRIH